MNRRRRSSAALVALLAALLLAGCAVIPTSGVVVQNDPTQAPEGDAAIVVQPNPPDDGARPEAIVRGFVGAASAGGDYTVAKQFLTPEFAEEWSPEARVLIHVDSWGAEQTADGAVELQVPLAATVDDDGVLKAASGTTRLQFRLQQVRGQWRISAADDGVVLSQPAFLQRFAPVPLQFWDLAYQRFVPDLRWFLAPAVDEAQRAQRAESVLRALLDGEAAQLDGVTASAFPAGTAIAEPVRVTGGRTAIELEVPGGAPDRQTTDRMQQQLAGSLQVSTSSIRLTVGGVLAPIVQQSDVEQPAEQDPVVVAGGRFGTLSQTGLREDQALGPRIVALDPQAVTVSPGQGFAAVLTDEAQVAVVTQDDGEPRVVDRRRGLAAPAVDQQGWVYSVPADDPTGLRAADASGRSIGIPTVLGGSSVLSIEVSPEGSRMLVLVRTDTGPTAFVAGIQRDADGAPVGLAGVRYVVPIDADDAVDATWVSPTTVAVLTSGAPVQTVVVQQLGGVSSFTGPLSPARAIVGATTEQDLRALLLSGDLQQRPTTEWQSEFASPVEVEVLAVQR